VPESRRKGKPRSWPRTDQIPTTPNRSTTVAARMVSAPCILCVSEQMEFSEEMTRSPPAVYNSHRKLCNDHESANADKRTTRQCYQLNSGNALAGQCHRLCTNRRSAPAALANT